MNSGIQDADNLAWKLAAVIKGQAGIELLRSYESERKPIALANTALSMQNWHEALKVSGSQRTHSSRYIGYFTLKNV